MFNENSVSSERIIYTPSNFAKSSLLYLQETGTLSALKPHESSRSKLSSFLFFIVLGGSGHLVYDEEVFTLSKGDCVFIDCKKPYSHKTSRDLWQLQWVHFNGETAQGIYRKYCERGGQPVFHLKNVEEIKKILCSLYETANSEDFVKDMRINEYLSGLLTIIMDTSLQPERQRDDKNNLGTRLEEITKYINDNLTEQFTLESIANRFYVNKFYLSRTFRKKYGDTLFTYIAERRITKAKRLLRFTDKTVEDICYECGFNDPNYFARIFKKYETCSPSEYRTFWLQ